jgi:hypothetical protein
MADQEEKVDQQEETAAEPAAEETPAEESAEAETAPEAEAAEEAEAAAEAEAAPEAEAEAEPAAEPEPAAEAEAEPAAEPEAAAEAPAEEPEAAAAESASEAEPEQPEYTFEVLHKMTVAQLRDIAQGMEHDALAGYSTMHKEQLVPALCAALGIEAHVHHEVVGIDKAKVKAKIKDLKVLRAQALEAGDHAQLKQVRSRIKSLKRKIRRATV